jgi:ADP-heptose:LPS heptosyltransferase
LKVGILKPDHLGDLVLAAPAVAALRRRFRDPVLFCHPKNLGLAGHLFPGLEARPVLFPYLDKDRGDDARALAQTRATLTDAVDLLVCLRWDGPVEMLVRDLGLDYRTFGTVTNDVHVAVEHRLAVVPYTDHYPILDSYAYPHAAPMTERPRAVRNVGLCISAGFRLNSWPLCHWLDLARCLDQRGARAVLLGGPAEASRLAVLADAIAASLGYAPRVIVGGSDFGTTLRTLAEAVDLVVATDSGTAHLASLVRPVVSLFGGSPWRRFAPLGRFNVVLSRRYPCSPCWQFMRDAVNLCQTQECLNNLFPEQVDASLGAYLDGVALDQPRQVEGVWMAQAPWEENALAAA